MTIVEKYYTISPELDSEPVWTWDDTPALGAVLLSVHFSERHGRKHVGHVVALKAQIDLGASL